jgi:L-fuconolactonase
VSIVGVDWTLPGALEELTQSVDAGAVGVRLRPVSRSPGDDPLAIWRRACDLQLIVSCVGTAAQFVDPAFDALLAELPNLPVVLEHLGGLARPDVGNSIAAEPAIAALARHGSVYLKLPGLGQSLPRAALAMPESRAAALGGTSLPAICQAFGGRLMWGSDFPVVSTREGYANAFAWARDAVPEAERLAIFGETASAIFSPKADFWASVGRREK